LYHIGLIQYVISPKSKGMMSADLSVQAVVRMWDENLLILGVDKRLSLKVKKGDYILADYTPLSPESGHRKLSVIKIIPTDEGRAIWEEFQSEFERRKGMVQQQPAPGQVRYVR
jgi:hypothetical protein